MKIYLLKSLLGKKDWLQDFAGWYMIENRTERSFSYCFFLFLLKRKHFSVHFLTKMWNLLILEHIIRGEIIYSVSWKHNIMLSFSMIINIFLISHKDKEIAECYKHILAFIRYTYINNTSYLLYLIFLLVIFFYLHKYFLQKCECHVCLKMLFHLIKYI